MGRRITKRSGGFDYGPFVDMFRDVYEIKKDLTAWLSDFLLTEAARALRLVRPLTPVDTGTLRRAWSISKVERSGDTLNVFLVNPLEYASFMEEGFTRVTANGEVWWEGLHMAEISLRQVSQAMPARFDKEWVKFCAVHGWG